MTKPIQQECHRGFGVYVHWPYCTRICPYCDFNVYAAKDRDIGPLLDALVADLVGWRERTGPRQVETVFLGGGTPSLLTVEQAAVILEKINALWGIEAGAEITIEANPEAADRLSGFAAAGVDRLSLGVQSLDDTSLKFLGRQHSAAEALAAIDAVRGAFRSLSLDFIYGLPGQNLDNWGRELERVLALGADHLSLYELSIEPGAAFAYAVRRGDWKPMDDDRAADIYELTQKLTRTAGYPAYEISNHARGDAHRSRHNSIYWQSGDWVGVGPGAHGRLTTTEGRFAIESERKPQDYMTKIANSGLGWTQNEILSPRDQARERIVMGLRIDEGIPERELDDLHLAFNAEPLLELEKLGKLIRRNGRIMLSEDGRLTADRIAAMISP